TLMRVIAHAGTRARNDAVCNWSGEIMRLGRKNDGVERSKLLWGTLLVASLCAGCSAEALSDRAEVDIEVVATASALSSESHSSMLLFDPAVDRYTIGYHSFRIPSIVKTNDGTLVAF